MRMQVSHGMAAVALVIVCACDGDSKPRAVVHRDSAGIRIVENPAQIAESMLPWQVDTIPHVTIGAVQGAEPYQLFRVTGATQLADGRILVVNAGTQELRFFDAQGTFITSVGRQGSGPGEFNFPEHIPSPGSDTLWVVDRGRRLVLLDTSGQLLETVAPGPSISTPIGILGGRIATSQGSARARPDTPEGMMPNDITYEIVDRTGESRDTVDQLQGFDLFLHNLTGNFGFTRVPFDVAPSAAVGTTRLFVTPGEVPEVRAFDAAGQLREIFRILQSPAPLSAADFDRVVDAEVGGASDQAQAAELQRRYSRMPRPAVMPSYQNLLVDSDDQIWLELFRADTDRQPEWIVLSSSGELLGRVRMPANVRFTKIGADYILGVTRGPEEIEQVVRYRLHRS